MPTKQECDDYAVATVTQFDAFVDWAIAHWPDQQAPLSADAFCAARRDLSRLLAARLDAAIDGERNILGKETTTSSSVGPSDASEQYVNMNPAPWP